MLNGKLTELPRHRIAIILHPCSLLVSVYKLEAMHDDFSARRERGIMT